MSKTPDYINKLDYINGHFAYDEKSVVVVVNCTAFVHTFISLLCIVLRECVIFILNLKFTYTFSVIWLM